MKAQFEDMIAHWHQPEMVEHRNQEEIYVLQHGDASSYVRLPYSTITHLADKIDILTGNVGWYDVASDLESSVFKQHLTDSEVDQIRKKISLEGDFDWHKIKKQFNDWKTFWDGDTIWHGSETKKQFKWTANVLDKRTVIPRNIYFLCEHLMPYFNIRSPNIALYLATIMDIMGLETKYIPLAPHRETVKKMKLLFERIAADYDEDTHNYKFTDTALKKKPEKEESMESVMKKLFL